MITLSYLHFILWLALSFFLICAGLYLRLENQRKRRFIDDFQRLLIRSIRSPRGVEINVHGSIWRLSLAPAKAEDEQPQEVVKP